MEWRPIASVSGKYEVSNTGLVRNAKTKQVLKASQSGPRAKFGKGYFAVSLFFQGKALTKKVHRLVADAFIPNPHGLATVNHKNGDKSQNADTNLEWSSLPENIRHAYRTGVHRDRKRARAAAVCALQGVQQ